MKFATLDRKNKVYSVTKEMELSLDFADESIMSQIIPVLDTSSYDEDEYLVFTEDEKNAIWLALAQIMGGMCLDQGMGHVQPGEQILLNRLLSDRRRHVASIPADLNADQFVSEAKEWLFAIA